MDKNDRKVIVAETLLVVAETLTEVQGGGPVQYWFDELSKKLVERTEKIMNEVRASL